MSVYRRISVGPDSTDAGGTRRRRISVRTLVSGYGAPVKEGRTVARPVAPGYGGSAERARVDVPGYGSAPVALRLSRPSETDELPAAA